MGTGDNSEKVNRGEPVDARCIVEFRPNRRWKGEYGFDWFRIGDCEENGIKSDYIKEEIIGRYGDNLHQPYVNGNTTDPDNEDFDGRRYFYRRNTDKLIKEFEREQYYQVKDIIRLKEKGRKYEMEGGNSFVPYIVPWASLTKKNVAKVEMIIKEDSTQLGQIYLVEIRSMGNFIEFNTNKSNYEEGKLPEDPNKIKKFTYVSIDMYSKGKKATKQVEVGKVCDARNHKIILYNYIGILSEFTTGDIFVIPMLYINDFPKNTTYSSIKAYAYYKKEDMPRTLAGQLNVVNYDSKEVEICFIPVITSTEGVFANPLINDDSQGKDFDSVLREQKNYLREQKKYLRKYLAQSSVFPKFNDEEINGQSSNMFVCFDTTGFDVNRSNGVCVKNSENESLISKLLKSFKDRYENNYNNSYKIFFIGKKGYRKNKSGRLREIGGVAYRNNKSAVIFEKPSDSTVCHELLHCLGLFHSFSNENLKEPERKKFIFRPKGFTYQQCQTSNIMDYFQNNAGRDNPFELVSLWKWQWDKVRDKLEFDKTTE